MTTGQLLTFALFRLDSVNAHLWREEELVPLRPKPFAVLRYLVENPGRLVTKEEFTKAVWPGTYVGESSLKGYIRDLREVLADDPAASRFIETVARRGYRFIALVTTAPPVSSVKFQVSSSLPFPAPSPQNLTPNFVGRERERAQQELALRLALGAPSIATKGYAAQEVRTAYTRARELCQQLGETPQLFPALWGLCGFYIVRAELPTARELGEHLLRLAQNAQDQGLFIEALTLGAVQFYSGELVLTRAHLEQRIALYDSQQHHSLARLSGRVDPGVHCLSYAVATLWLLGYPTQALKMSHTMLTLAQELSHHCENARRKERR